MMSKHIAKFTVYLMEDGHSALKSQVWEAGKGYTPKELVTQAIGVLVQEREALGNCPIHRAKRRGRMSALDPKGLAAAIKAMDSFASYDTPTTLAEDCIRAYLEAASLTPPKGQAEAVALVVEWRRRVTAIGRDVGSYRQCADELEAALAVNRVKTLHLEPRKAEEIVTILANADWHSVAAKDKNGVYTPQYLKLCRYVAAEVWVAVVAAPILEGK